MNASFEWAPFSQLKNLMSAPSNQEMSAHLEICNACIGAHSDSFLEWRNKSFCQSEINCFL